MPRAASTISTGTPRSPVVMLRNRISSVYAVSAMIAVRLPNPVIGISRKNAATEGIV